MSYSPIKQVPYYSTSTTSSEHLLAKELRADVVPMLKRLLPYHHLGGLKHDFFIEFIKKYSSKYRYFIKTDIQKFFPNVRHQDLIVGIQLAHRKLHNLDYVPDKFKKKYIGRLLRWTNELPFDYKGIPLSSPVSGIAAPLMLLPLWLDIKRRWKLPISVFVDDVVILCENRQEVAEVYECLHNYLRRNFELELNAAKTESGQFSNGKFNFCGWNIAGGYARVSEKHVEAFKERFKQAALNSKGKERRVIIKSLNRKIDGFGNHYLCKALHK